MIAVSDCFTYSCTILYNILYVIAVSDGFTYSCTILYNILYVIAVSDGLWTTEVFRTPVQIVTPATIVLPKPQDID